MFYLIRPYENIEHTLCLIHSVYNYLLIIFKQEGLPRSAKRKSNLVNAVSYMQGNREENSIQGLKNEKAIEGVFEMNSMR
jgi:hypothetical protein